MPFPNSSFALAGKYTQIQRIGQGSGGKVYRAVDNLGRLVAVKEVLPSQASFINAQNRFEKEVRIHASLKHPKIIQVYHLEEDPRTHELYLICEYANGGSLADHLKAHGPLTEQQAIRSTLDICAALEEVSAKNFVHRDIKPSNILLFKDDRGQISEAKLADFGVAKDLDKRRAGQPTTQRGGSHPGTPEYMAPEQADITKPVDVRTDLYALGICLWEILTDTSYKLVRASTGPPALYAHNPQASPGIAEIIRRAAQDDPVDRYPTARAMAADLQDVLGGRSLAATPTITIRTSPPPRGVRVNRTLVTVLVLSLALAVLGFRAWRGSGLLLLPAPTSAPVLGGVADPNRLVVVASSPEATSVVPTPTVVTPAAPATSVAPAPTVVTPAAPTDAPTTIPTIAPTVAPTDAPTTIPTIAPTDTLIMATILTFTSQPEAGRQSIPLRLDQPGRYTLTFAQANPAGPYWIIWDYIGLLQGNTPLWEIGESEAPPDYTDAAFSEFCKPHIRSDCTSEFVVGTTSVGDFVYDINANERPTATITFTVTDQQANSVPTLVLSTLYASHDAIKRFALKVSLARAP
jgi:eukaryotic-like serine/threonine-protein kinase